MTYHPRATALDEALQTGPNRSRGAAMSREEKLDMARQSGRERRGNQDEKRQPYRS